MSLSGGGGTRYLSWSVGGKQHYLCSLQGLLRLLQALLLLVIVLLARFAGYNSSRLFFAGSLDTDMAGVGGSVGLLILVLLLLTLHLLAHPPPNLAEVLTNLVGTVLLLTVGGLCMAYYSNQYNNNNDKSAGVALGVITIVTGIVFLVDLILSLRYIFIVIFFQ